jgi:hypothetical protein
MEPGELAAALGARRAPLGARRAPRKWFMLPLTYMLIRARITALEAGGKLRRYVAKSRHPSRRRRLYLTEIAMKDLDNSSSAVNMLVGKGFVEASLTRWVSGGRIWGDKKRGRFLDRLRPPPPEIWEIRVTEPVTQARLFGRFAEPDTLILTKFHTRSLLGNKGSQAWTTAMAECAKTWSDLFPNHTPFIGSDIHAYVTENCDDFPISNN